MSKDKEFEDISDKVQQLKQDIKKAVDKFYGLESKGGLMKNFTNCDVCIETSKDNVGFEPTILIKEKDKTFMITITPDHEFSITDETGRWDIIDGRIKWINEIL